MDVVKIYNCARCSYETRNFWHLVKHYHGVHSSEPGFQVHCGVANCCKAYDNIKSLTAHMRSKHGDFYQEHMVQSKCIVNSVDNNSCEDELSATVCSSEFTGEDGSSVNLHSSSFCADSSTSTISADPAVLANNYVALWSLKLREINKVPGTVCEDLRSTLSLMLSESRDTIHKNVMAKLSQCGAPSHLMTAVTDALSIQTPYENACDGLCKEERVNKYVEHNFSFVAPVEYLMKNLDDNDNRVEYMQYVPLLESLKVLLKNDDIFACVMNGHQSTDGMLRDFCDGSIFRQHPLFATDEHALQIVLYYDDFGTVNPLGHRARQYKIASFYFMLANIPPKDRSRLHTIFLSTLFFHLHSSIVDLMRS